MILPFWPSSILNNPIVKQWLMVAMFVLPELCWGIRCMLMETWLCMPCNVDCIICISFGIYLSLRIQTLQKLLFSQKVSMLGCKLGTFEGIFLGNIQCFYYWWTRKKKSICTDTLRLIRCAVVILGWFFSKGRCLGIMCILLYQMFWVNCFPCICPHSSIYWSGWLPCSMSSYELANWWRLVSMICACDDYICLVFIILSPPCAFATGFSW